MAIQLDEDAMRPIIAKAVLDEIGPEQRDALVQSALDTLMKPHIVKGQYGRPDERGPSMLEEIVRDQVHQLAGAVVREILAEPEHAERLRSQIREGVLVAMQAGSEAILSTIGYAAGEAISNVLRNAQ